VKTVARWLASRGMTEKIVAACLLVAIAGFVLGAVAATHTAGGWWVVCVGSCCLLVWLVGRWVADELVAQVRSIRVVLHGMADECAAVIADGLHALALGDLTVPVQLHMDGVSSCGSDELGQALNAANDLLDRIKRIGESYEVARTRLHETIQSVAGSSDEVRSSAAQLADTTDQLGETSTQIATAIEEVARGTMLQSRNSYEVSHQMSTLSAMSQRVAVVRPRSRRHRRRRGRR